MIMDDDDRPHTGRDRIDKTLGFIGRTVGNDDRRQVEGQLRASGLDLDQVDRSLSIGGFRGLLSAAKSDEETHRRDLVRAVLLTEIANGSLPMEQVEASKQALMQKSSPELDGRLNHQFAYKPFAGDFEHRAQWKPEQFTNPVQHSQDNYMYVVHGLRSGMSNVADLWTQGNKVSTPKDHSQFNKLYEKYEAHAQIVEPIEGVRANLKVDFMARVYDNPDLLKQNIISASVISNDKHPTFVPAGFILRVPPECVYATAEKDAGLSNRTNDVVGELSKVQRENAGRIRPPQDILGGTSKADGGIGYNEIALVGTAPEGKQVEVVGIFVKTDMNHNLYADKDVEPYFSEHVQQLIGDCARKFNLPIVAIPDREAGVRSNTPWPFGETQRLVQDRRQGYDGTIVGMDNAGHVVVRKEGAFAGPPEDRIHLGHHDLQMGDRVHVSVDPARGIRAVKQAQALHASFAPAYDGRIVKVEGDGHVTVQKIGAQSRQPPERIHLGGDPGLQVGQQVHVSGEPGHRQVTSREQAHVQAPKIQSRL